MHVGEQPITESRVKILVEVDDAYHSYGRRVWHAFRRTIPGIALSFFFGLLVHGWSGLIVCVVLGFMLFVFLMILRGTRKALLRVTLDESSGMVTIETVRYSTRKVDVFAKERVYIGAMMNMWSWHMKANMIRIDVDRKTWYVQKSYVPWGQDQFEAAGKIPRKL